MMFAYTVRCEFDREDVADEWIAWLRDEHLRDVCDAGAIGAEVVRLDDATNGVAIEVRYRFADRGAFEQYEKEHAPRLRAEGLKRFPPELGLRYTRSTGEMWLATAATTDRGRNSPSRGRSPAPP